MHRTIGWGRVGSLALLMAGVLFGSTPSGAGALQEVPSLAAEVAAGKLPPVDKRLPEEPLVMPLDTDGLAPGKSGGRLETLFGRAKDIRMLVVYGYARLVGYDRNFNIVPDVAKAFEVKDGREFTFHLRKGHKWSDGHPFTTEDFRYFFEDMAADPVFSEEGPPDELLVDGKLPKFEVLDETTVRYTWEKPNPLFLGKLAEALPLYLYRPAHFLKQFHVKYADKAKLDELVAKAEARNWRELHYKMDRMSNADVVELPTLDPWVNSTESPSERYVFKRNPYFHRVDASGMPLPYLDEVVATVANNKLIPAKVGAGESMLQARNLEFKNYTVLKSSAERNGYSVRLWKSGRGSQFVLFPNLNVTDPAWQKLFRDVRFRRALSSAVDRSEVNQVVFFGLGIESNNTVLSDSPLFKPEYQESFAKLDLDLASKLLDEVGLDKKNDAGIRLLPDGREAEIIVETAGEDTNETDVLELVKESWAKAGIKLFVKTQTREVLDSRVASGDAMMSTWTGLENGVATADFPPYELAPTRDDQPHWPMWGLHTMTGGKGGVAIDEPNAAKLTELYWQWMGTGDADRRAAIWHEMLAIHADQVFTIGLVAAVPQPVVVSNKLKNVPEKGIYNFDPGAFFGIYHPDTFWLDAK